MDPLSRWPLHANAVSAVVTCMQVSLPGRPAAARGLRPCTPVRAGPCGRRPDVVARSRGPDWRGWWPLVVVQQKPPEGPVSAGTAAERVAAWSHASLWVLGADLPVLSNPAGSLNCHSPVS